MNLPGFTADTSIYKAIEHYRAMGGTPSELVSGRGVRLQLPQELQSCLSRCDFSPHPNLCNYFCYYEYGGGGQDGQGGHGPQPCSRTCGACLGDPGSSTGRSKTCRMPNCEWYTIECL